MSEECVFCHKKINWVNGNVIQKCKYCGKVNVSEREISQEESYNKACMLAHEGRYEAALEIFNDILKKDEGHFLARWQRLLCKHGIVYEREDEKKNSITFRKKIDDKVFNEEFDNELNKILTQADRETGKQISNDADFIKNTLAKIKKLSENTNSAYEVFLCYKETEENSYRTEESYQAEVIHRMLERKGFRSFFAPEALAKKTGEDYEALIYYAVLTSKVMLVIGFSKEHFESTWVKSEWTRFLQKSDIEKKLIPIFNNSDDIPAELKGQGKSIEDIRGHKYQNLISDVSRYTRDSTIYIEDRIPKYKFNDFTDKGAEKYIEGAEKIGSNSEEAFMCFKEAAKEGNADATYQVGVMKKLGEGTDKNVFDGKNWCEEAFALNYKR